jgi:2-methylisocitrate lyase-like PEP mutase family enzyme
MPALRGGQLKATHRSIKDIPDGRTQAAETRQFRALHEAADAFVAAVMGRRLGPDDGRLGRATSSGASAGLLGRRDGRVTRDEALAQATVTCEATDLPVSTDLEKDFGEAPEFVAETEQR